MCSSEHFTAARKKTTTAAWMGSKYTEGRQVGLWFAFNLAATGNRCGWCGKSERRSVTCKSHSSSSNTIPPKKPWNSARQRTRLTHTLQWIVNAMLYSPKSLFTKFAPQNHYWLCIYVLLLILCGEPAMSVCHIKIPISCPSQTLEIWRRRPQPSLNYVLGNFRFLSVNCGQETNHKKSDLIQVSVREQSWHL